MDDPLAEFQKALDAYKEGLVAAEEEAEREKEEERAQAAQGEEDQERLYYRSAARDDDTEGTDEVVEAQDVTEKVAAEDGYEEAVLEESPSKLRRTNAFVDEESSSDTEKRRAKAVAVLEESLRRTKDEESSSDTEQRRAKAVARAKAYPWRATENPRAQPILGQTSKASAPCLSEPLPLGARSKASAPSSASATSSSAPYKRGNQMLRHNTGKYANRGGRNRAIFNAKYGGFQNYHLDARMAGKAPPPAAAFKAAPSTAPKRRPP